MALEQLMAFTVSEDHERQTQVWDAIKDAWSKEPYQIRRMLTETTVRASDKRAVFLGIGAYEAAGGIVMRDLFQRSEEHTSELQSLMRISYAVFSSKKQNT